MYVGARVGVRARGGRWVVKGRGARVVRSVSRSVDAWVGRAKRTYIGKV